MISETMVNFTEAEKFCWNQQEMRLIRVMTEQKYHDVVNFAKRWLFGQFQMDGARWHREDFHTDMRITIVSAQGSSCEMVTLDNRIMYKPYAGTPEGIKKGSD